MMQRSRSTGPTSEFQLAFDPASIPSVVKPYTFKNILGNDVKGAQEVFNIKKASREASIASTIAMDHSSKLVRGQMFN